MSAPYVDVERLARQGDAAGARPLIDRLVQERESAHQALTDVRLRF